MKKYNRVEMPFKSQCCNSCPLNIAKIKCDHNISNIEHNNYLSQSSYRVCNGAHPSHSPTLHFCDVVFARYLPEMCAARHDMVQIACGCAAHTVFVLTVAPQMFRCRGGSLSRAYSVGRPPCTPRQCVTTRKLFF